MIHDGRLIIGNDRNAERKRLRSLVDFDGLRLCEGWRNGDGLLGEGVVAVKGGLAAVD